MDFYSRNVRWLCPSFGEIESNILFLAGEDKNVNL